MRSLHAARNRASSCRKDGWVHVRPCNIDTAKSNLVAISPHICAKTSYHLQYVPISEDTRAMCNILEHRSSRMTTSPPTWIPKQRIGASLILQREDQTWDQNICTPHQPHTLLACEECLLIWMNERSCLWFQCSPSLRM